MQSELSRAKQELLRSCPSAAHVILKELEKRVEVVRCEECVFAHRDYDYERGYVCEKPLYHPQVGERPHRKLMQDCDFCSHGVREIR